MEITSSSVSSASVSDDSLSAESAPGVALKLLAASFLSLFVELLLIRWIPSTVHVVGFFNNLVLIGCFLGLGMGMAAAIDERLAARRALLRLTFAVVLLGVMNFFNPTIDRPNWSDYGLNEIPVNQEVRLPITPVLIGVFGLVVFTSIPFGQLVAAYFDRLPRIRAYTVNVAGSLLGVLAFTGIAWLSLPPIVWFGAAVATVYFLSREVRDLVPTVAIFAVLAAIYVFDSAGERRIVRWSPYYKLMATPIARDDAGQPGKNLSGGFTVEISNQFLLSGFDLRPESKIPESVASELQQGIELSKSYYPFPFLIHPPRRVLVLGAGAGNDVATALRHGAEHVTAVEIDRLVVDIGRKHHPEQPYASPKVRVVCNDARAFLNHTDEKFDLILFATLDAHGLLSSVGNVRLDSFIYTEESIAAARRRLADDGLLVLAFGPFREDTQLRQYSTVRRVFSQDPLYFGHKNGHRAIVAGAIAQVKTDKLPPNWRRFSQQRIDETLAKHPYAATPATDNWPHLYIRQPRVPREYLGVLAGILVLSGVLVAVRFRSGFAVDGHFFSLGAGFLLLETKSITEFALLIGSTWLTNSIVFVAILVMILLANLVALRGAGRLPLPLIYGLLAVLLVAGYAFPISQWAVRAGTPGILLAGVFLGSPMFLAGLVFATTFANARSGSAALASNLLGAVVGGTAEYLSLAYGIRFLNLLALAFYVGSAVCWHLARRTASAPAAATAVPTETAPAAG